MRKTRPLTREEVDWLVKQNASGYVVTVSKSEPFFVTVTKGDLSYTVSERDNDPYVNSGILVGGIGNQPRPV